MKGGRKNLKRATEEESSNLEECHNIIQVLSLVVSNLVEVVLLLLTIVGRKRLLNHAARWRVLFPKFYPANKSAHFRNHKNGQKSSNPQFWTIVESSDDDGLPPLKANTNRIRPYDSHAKSDSGSDSD